ncbi:MAG TPA: efflux RND transporter periplasmic adaptor subunit [Chitinophagaceae bacterium]
MKWSCIMSIVLFAFAACGTRESTAEEPKDAAPENVVLLSEAEMKTAGITVGQPQKGMVRSWLKVNGLVEAPPQNVVSVSFPLGGYLASTKLMPGMSVRKGQPIAEMKDQAIIQLQQDYLIARSKVGFLQKEYERQKLLNTTKTTSDKVLEQTQSEYQAQRILMYSLGEKLRMIRIDPASLTERSIRQSAMIYSPIDGYVSAVNVNMGKYVTPSDVLFELVNPRNLHLAVKIFEKDLASVKKGQSVQVSLVNNPGKTYEAEVALVSRNLDDDRSAVVHCHFTHPTVDLLPGMFADAQIAVENKEALTVPEDAVVRWGDAQYLFVEKGKGAFEMVPVQVGTTNEGRTEIGPLPADLSARPMIVRNAYAALMKLQNKAE